MAVCLSEKEDSSVLDIHRYDLQTQQWTKLHQYHYWDFTMTEINHQLTLVGGCDVSTHKTTNAVAVYASSQRSWEQPYPPMNTPRMFPAVSTYHQRLVVAGGCDVNFTDLATVEILNTSTHHSQWLSTIPLPVRCRRMSSAIIDDTLYLLGGSLGKQVLSVSLSALTQTDKPPAQWHALSDAPLEWSTAIAANGFLLAVGGSITMMQYSSAIHIYNQKNNTWMKVGDLPTKRDDQACCLLSSEEILAAGGQNQDNMWTKELLTISILT